MDENEKILREGKVAVVALAADNDYPYAVPLNYVYANGFIYIHCAKQGHKIDVLRQNPKCSVCIIEKDEIVPEKFTTYYRSVIAFGYAKFVNDTTEKREALERLAAKYSPGLDPTREIEKSIKAVAIIKLELEKITGKQSIELTN